MFKLNPSKSIVRLLSNDAFFWLKNGEEPLDESNLDEAYEIMEMFPDGFSIADDWDYTDDDDTIKATFIPHEKEENPEWDGECRTGNPDMLPFKFRVIGPNKCYAHWFSRINNKLLYEGECDIVYIATRPYAQTPGRSLIPLFGKNCVYFTDKRFTYNKEVSKCIQVK